MTARSWLDAASRRRPSALVLGFAALAVAALAGAVSTWRSARAIARRHAPRGAFLCVDGVRLHYLEAGSGPTVLLLHGNAVTAEDWRLSGLFQALSRRCRVIAPDRPGYGHSNRPRDRLWTPKAQADLFARLLQALDADPAVVVGHSLGVQPAVRLALERPELVRGLVLASGYYFPSLRLDSLLVGAAAIPGLGDLWRRTFAAPLGRAMVEPVARLMFGPQPTPPDYAHGPLEMSLRPPQSRAVAADGFYMLGEALALQSRLRALQLPTAIVYGEGDRIVEPGAQSQRLAGMLPQAKLLAVPGGGHMAQYLAVDAVAELTESLAA